MSEQQSSRRHHWRSLALAVALASASLASATSQAQESLSHVQLSAQPLGQALNELARQTGSNIIVPGSLTEGRQAPAVSGELSVEQALRLLLKGTELEAQPAGDNYIIVRAERQEALVPVLKKVVVTGSNIRRSEAEGANAVQTISADQIAKSGKQNVADLLRALPANSGRIGENSNENWAVGAAGVGLHGLGPKNTLVLLNGRRIANNAMPTSGLGDTFVDLNSLPVAALERIEILKDGASAIYGSDAVAGVVNLITRQNYQGLETRATTGAATQGGAEQDKVSVFGGSGDLEQDGYNLFFSFDGYTRNRLDQDERGLTKYGDYSGKPGGSLNGWSAQGARFLNANGSSVPLLDANGNCPAGTVLRPSAPIDGRAGNTCAYSLTSELTSVAGTERYQLFNSGTFKLSDTTELFYEGLYNHTHGNTNWYIPYYVQTAGNLAINPSTGLPEAVSNTLPAGSPNNPYGQDVSLDYTFFNLGQTSRNTSADSYRLLTGLRGDWQGWEWEGTVFHSVSKVAERRRGGQANRYALAQAIRDGSYNLANPELTSQETLDSIRLSTTKNGRSELTGTDLRFSRSLFDLPAGPVDFAGGLEWREETQKVDVPWQMSSGIMVRPHIQQVDSEHKVSAVYGEFNIPLTDTLEAQVAARGDYYSDVGAAFSPKYSLRWQPLKPLMFRASASRGFRAPSLAENSSNNLMLANNSVFDPAQGKRVAITGYQTGNDDLDPERTRTYSFGVVFSPSALTSVSLDYYNLQVDDVIGFEAADAVVARNNPDEVIRDAQGYVTSLKNRLQNLSQLKTSGVELELSQLLPTQGFGDFSVASSFSYIKDYRIQRTTDGPLVDIAGGNLNLTAKPKLKGQTRFGWNYSDWETQLTWNHSSGYKQEAVAKANGVRGRVKAYNTFDAYLGYTGFKDLTLFTTVENIENKRPPYDPLGYTVYALSLRAPYDAGNYDQIGRYVRVGLEYKFF